MPNTRQLQGSEVESVRNAAQLHVLRAALGEIARSLPPAAQDALLLRLEVMAEAADEANAEEVGPGVTEEFSHQTNLAARKLSERIKNVLGRE